MWGGVVIQDHSKEFQLSNCWTHLLKEQLQGVGLETLAANHQLSMWFIAKEKDQT